MAFTLQDANLHSPDALRNRIVRRINQMGDDARLVTNDIFPLVELGNTTERYFTMDGMRSGMRRSAIGAESPIADIESLGEQDVTVKTFKEKLSPEKGVDTELNGETEILNLFNAVSDALMEDILLTRAVTAWQSGGPDLPGLIGADGQTVHPEIPSNHVLTPSTPYDDTSVDILQDMVDIEYNISEDGTALGQAGPVTAFITPSILRDFKLNDDLQSNYENVSVLSDDQISTAFQVDRIRVIRTQVVRRNANGQPVDENGDVVTGDTAWQDAARDNVLEPYAGGSNHRNIVIGAPGQVSAFMPFFLDRLEEMGSQAPTGDVSVDGTNGWMTQTWTEPDPLVSWYKAAQEIGFHMTRGNNWAVIQDI